MTELRSFTKAYPPSLFSTLSGITFAYCPLQHWIQMHTAQTMQLMVNVEQNRLTMCNGSLQENGILLQGLRSLAWVSENRADFMNAATDNLTQAVIYRDKFINLGKDRLLQVWSKKLKQQNLEEDNYLNPQAQQNRLPESISPLKLPTTHLHFEPNPSEHFAPLLSNKDQLFTLTHDYPPYLSILQIDPVEQYSFHLPCSLQGDHSYNLFKVDELIGVSGSEGVRLIDTREGRMVMHFGREQHLAKWDGSYSIFTGSAHRIDEFDFRRSNQPLKNVFTVRRSCCLNDFEITADKKHLFAVQNARTAIIDIQ